MNTVVRTSLTHPIRIDEIVLSSGNKLGLSFCPGKKQTNAMTGIWDRDLATDIKAIKDWGARRVLTILHPDEFRELDAHNLGGEVFDQGMEWSGYFLANDSVPNLQEGFKWYDVRRGVHRELRQQHNVFIHCKGGIGRTSMVAAMILIESGYDPNRAVELVGDARPGSFYMEEQRQFVLNYHPNAGLLPDSVYYHPVSVF